MKYYQICNENCQKCNKDYQNCNRDYQICNARTEKIVFQTKPDIPQKTQIEHKKPPTEEPLYIEKKKTPYINYDKNHDRNYDSNKLSSSLKTEVNKGVSKDRLIKLLQGLPEDKHPLLKAEYFKKWVNKCSEGPHNAKLWQEAEGGYYMQKKQVDI